MDDKAILYPGGQGPPLPAAIGRFQVLERAPGGGRGSQATVYRARDPQSGREVAVKVMGSRYDSFASSLLAVLVGDRDVEELRREAELLASLHHPHIVAVLETGEDMDHGPYTVMEWVAGGDLKAHMERAKDGRLPVEEALRIAGDVLAGLAAAHGTGLVHRDVKPGNILLDSHGRAKLADFGIAGDATAGALTGRGTPGYMAPEQEDPVGTGAVGPPVDIYAVGVVLFEMLAGRLPSPGEEVRRLRSGVSGAVSRAVARALHPDPKERFSSAEAMALALGDISGSPCR